MLDKLLPFLMKWLGNFKTYTVVGAGIGTATEKFMAGELTLEQYLSVIGVGAAFATVRATLGKVMKYLKAISAALELINSNPQAKIAMQKALNGKKNEN